MNVLLLLASLVQLHPISLLSTDEIGSRTGGSSIQNSSMFQNLDLSDSRILGLSNSRLLSFYLSSLRSRVLFVAQEDSCRSLRFAVNDSRRRWTVKDLAQTSIFRLLLSHNSLPSRLAQKDGTLFKLVVR